MKLCCFWRRSPWSPYVNYKVNRILHVYIIGVVDTKINIYANFLVNIYLCTLQINFSLEYPSIPTNFNIGTRQICLLMPIPLYLMLTSIHVTHGFLLVLIWKSDHNMVYPIWNYTFKIKHLASDKAYLTRIFGQHARHN